FRVDHGGRQPRAFPPLGKLARRRADCTDCGDRPRRSNVCRTVCTALFPAPPPRGARPPITRHGAARLGLSARTEIPCVLDGVAVRRRLKPLRVGAYFSAVALRRAPGMMEERTPVHFYMVSGGLASAARARLQGASRCRGDPSPGPRPA